MLIALLTSAACAHEGDMPANCPHPVKARVTRVVLPEYPARLFRDKVKGRVKVRIEVSNPSV